MQWGPLWWFNDHEGGMRRQLDDLSEVGQLSGFIGMLTDSQSDCVICVLNAVRYLGLPDGWAR